MYKQSPIQMLFEFVQIKIKKVKQSWLLNLYDENTIQQKVRYVCSTRWSKNIYNNESRLTGPPNRFWRELLIPQSSPYVVLKRPTPNLTLRGQTLRPRKDAEIRDMATPIELSQEVVRERQNRREPSVTCWTREGSTRRPSSGQQWLPYFCQVLVPKAFPPRLALVSRSASSIFASRFSTLSSFSGIQIWLLAFQLHSIFTYFQL